VCREFFFLNVMRESVSLMSAAGRSKPAAQLRKRPSETRSRVRRRAKCLVRLTGAECRRNDRTVLQGTVMQYHAGCRTSICTAWTIFGSTLATSGAAFEELTHETEEIHHKEVWPKHLAHVEDDVVLIVSCKRTNHYSNPSATGLALVSVCTVYSVYNITT